MEKRSIEESRWGKPRPINRTGMWEGKERNRLQTGSRSRRKSPCRRKSLSRKKTRGKGSCRKRSGGQLQKGLPNWGFSGRRFGLVVEKFRNEPNSEDPELEDLEGRGLMKEVEGTKKSRGERGE